MARTDQSYYDTTGLSSEALDFAKAMIVLRKNFGDTIAAEDAELVEDLTAIPRYKRWSRLFFIIAKRARRDSIYRLPLVITNTTQGKLELY